MAGRRRSRGLTAVLIAMALYLLVLAVPNLGPAYRAARADGAPGVFTARQLQCVRHPGHESCTWNGEFQSDDGRIHRTDVSLKGGGQDSLRPGERTGAVDVGRANRVYGPDGSNEWVVVALMILMSAVFLAVAAARTRPRRAAAAVPASATDGGHRPHDP